MNNGSETDGTLLIPIGIEDEMKKSYLDYSMSVIVSRALPDARDGLKPVHRRILYVMHEANNYGDKPYKKSATVVGDAMGKYHPHGDSAIYGSLVRMAQDFSLRVPLVDGQGNFGSMDGDPPAQMRYTEVRLAKISNFMLNDIELNTVDFQDNYDGSRQEPTILPARFPQLLVNGSSGIAVGMATNIPTHNLGEICQASIAYIDNPNISITELLEIVPGPDFPTGGIITSAVRARLALSTGRASVTMRAKTHFEVLGGRDAIVVTEIPFQVNKAEMLRRIEMLARNKEIEGLAEIRDESNKLGVRVVVELKKGVEPEVILNQLFKFTPMQSNFPANMLALDHGQPKLMNLYDLIKSFVEFREEVIYRRVSFLLNKARTRMHVLIGLYISVSNIEEVIQLIKSSPNPKVAQEKLMNTTWKVLDIAPLLALVDDSRNELKNNLCNLTEEQARAILDMKLARLTALEKNKIYEALQELAAQTREYIKILSSRAEILNVIKQELEEIIQKHATPRMTEILQLDDDVDMEDLIQQEDMVVTLSYAGYIKRVPLVTYRSQRRGGKGRSAMNTYEDDFTAQVISTNTHETLLFFSDSGKVYKSKVYKVPLGGPNTRGRALVNLLPLGDDEKISNIIKINDTDFENHEISIIFSTTSGKIRRNSVADFANIQSNGKIAIRLTEGDKLVAVRVCKDSDHIFITSSSGKAIRFPVSVLRVFKSRTSDGIRGIRLQGTDKVVATTILHGIEMPIEERDEFLKISYEERLQIAVGECENRVEIEENCSIAWEKLEEYCKAEEFILTITANGFGKRTSAYEYRVSGRGGQGITNINTSSRNGEVVSSFVVEEDDEVILITNGGTLLRTEISSIRISGRNTMGVNIIRTNRSEKVVSVAKIDNQDDNKESGENNALENSAQNEGAVNDNGTEESVKPEAFTNERVEEENRKTELSGTEPKVAEPELQESEDEDIE